jgi:Ice-binding-like
MKIVSILTVLSFIGLFTASGRADTLGTADTYAVLGATTVTNTGATVLSGDLGLSPGTSITGFYPAGEVINGSIYSGPTSPAAAAQIAATTGYTTLAALPSTENLSGTNLGGLVLTPGVYTYSTSAELSGSPLTLNFEDLDGATIVLQIGSTLTTGSNATVAVENLGTDDNVYYDVGSSATLGTGTVFLGDILATDSITLNTGADITCGSAIALTGAVTLEDNTISNCSSSGSDVSSTVSTSVAPEPSAIWLLSTGLLAGAGLFHRRLFA